ncbi:hypothetical protein [Chelatococcus reniformis]|uniref:Uncharacterized protein n=1 Tax=Chelatococcus reniformis TaxID=1494448 RepID=A0A916XFH2_9HYPH|nr:hypothetical protein [Chelatococcus reniformis]GGC68324.1 hypothetical protein GCM10010994_28630 [Chelatococcus reniformis]
MSTIDLRPFCGHDFTRPMLMKPWSRGDHTYAADGAILVRVPRRAEVEENSDIASLAEARLAECDFSTLRPVALVRLPAPLCEEDEDGYVGPAPTSVRLFGHLIQLRYAQILFSLDDLRIGAPRDAVSPIPFGSHDLLGVLMPCGRPMARHFDIETPATVAAAPPAGLLGAAEKLAAIADAYDANDLEDEARKRWGANLEFLNPRAPEDIELYASRGGRRLLTLQDCMDARAALRGGAR